MPDAMPELPRSSTALVWSGCATGPTRGLPRVVIYADREQSANLAYLTGFDPSFEEAILGRGAEGEPAILVGNESGHGRGGAAADAATSVTGPEPA